MAVIMAIVMAIVMAVVGYGSPQSGTTTAFETEHDYCPEMTSK